MHWLDLLIILLYFAGMLIIGIVANRRQKDVTDYYVAGRKMGSVSIMCLWISAWIGGASIMGTSARAYDMGITAIWYVGIIAVGVVLFALIATKPVKRLSNKLNNLTFPDFIENRYDSKTRIASTITTILAYVAYTASQFVAGAAILQTITSWPLHICFIVVTIVIVLYTSVGGMLAVTYTDVAQMAILFTGIVLIAVPISSRTMSAEGLSITNLPESYFDIGAWGWSSILALGLSTVFSFFTSMDCYTKVFAAKDERTARNGTLMAALAVVIIAVASTFLGLAAKLLVPGLESGSSALAELVLRWFPSGIRGIVLAAILAAIMSTGDVCVLTASSNITRDIYQRYINPNVSQKKMLTLSVISSAVVGILSAVFAWYQQDIINVLFIAFTINSAGLFLPTVLGMFWKRSNSTAAFASTVIALVIVLTWYIGAAVSELAIFQIDALWPAFGLSALVYFILCFTCSSSKEEKAKIEFFFETAKAE